MRELFALYEKWKEEYKKCHKCGHYMKDHIYGWFGPWDSYSCKYCDCEL